MYKLQEQHNTDLKQKTAWDFQLWDQGSRSEKLNHENSIKNDEIDVESLWQVQPEIKN